MVTMTSKMDPSSNWPSGSPRHQPAVKNSKQSVLTPTTSCLPNVISYFCSVEASGRDIQFLGNFGQGVICKLLNRR
jgi:hypothetical protein